MHRTTAAVSSCPNLHVWGRIGEAPFLWLVVSTVVTDSVNSNRAKGVEKPLVFDQGSRLLIEDVGFHQVFTKRWAQMLHVMFHEDKFLGETELTVYDCSPSSVF
jgi:hypothetical protein